MPPRNKLLEEPLYIRNFLLQNDCAPILELLLKKLGYEVIITLTNTYGGAETEYKLTKKRKSSVRK